MYKLQERPDGELRLENGARFTPVATLVNEHGGRAQIHVDDHCYVLANGSKKHPYGISAWWFREAVEALRNLPLPD